ncbi:hypothetical protein PoB_000770800 [Plakobranchus ocellatus]|uniref:Uncharacterized protein n=1 Tax=Plakobranchus ocellatus TaxID=259542 RepID=A0AAV3YGD5_9GAST|nr:hypothetical protein PoB_000770800 [Plakobranchus ocellatus]
MSGIMSQSPLPQSTRGSCLNGQNLNLVTHHASMSTASIYSWINLVTHHVSMSSASFYSWIMSHWSEPHFSHAPCLNVHCLNLLVDHVSVVRTSI